MSFSILIRAQAMPKYFQWCDCSSTDRSALPVLTSAGQLLPTVAISELAEKATDSVPGLDGGAILGHHRRPSICAYPTRLTS